MNSQGDLFGFPEPVLEDRPGPKRVRYWKNKDLGQDTEYVGRPTKWGNPFVVGTPRAPDRPTAVKLFREWLPTQPRLIAQAKKELRGKNVACWCPEDGQPCHGDVWIEVANSD